MKKYLVFFTALLIYCISFSYVHAFSNVQELKPGIYNCSYEFRRCVATVKSYKTKFSGHCPGRTFDIKKLADEGKCRYRYIPDLTQRYVCIYADTACEIVTEKDEIVSAGCVGGNGMLDIAKQDYLRGACKKIQKNY